MSSPLVSCSTQLFLCILAVFLTCAHCYRDGFGEGLHHTTDGKKRAGRLTDWLHDLSPKVNSRLRVMPSDVHGGGLFFAAPSTGEVAIAAGEVILEVPAVATISEEAVLKHRPYSKLLAGKVANELLVILSVAVEVALGERSAFPAWIGAFPPIAGVGSPEQPFMWPDDILDQIQPASARDLCRSRHHAALNEFAEQTPLIAELNAYITAAQGTATIDWKLFAYAKVLVETRGWLLNGSYYLVPGADFINYASGGSRDSAFDFTQKGLPRTVEHPKVLEHIFDVVDMDADVGVEHAADRRVDTRHRRVVQVKADRRYLLYKRSGPVEVLHSYGHQTSDVIMAHHGFFPEGNVYDCQPINLKVGAPPPSRRSLVYQRVHGVMERAAAVCLHIANDEAIEGFSAGMSPLLTFVSLVYAADQLLENSVAEAVGECLNYAGRTLHDLDDVYRLPHSQAEAAAELALLCLVDPAVSELAERPEMVELVLDREVAIAAQIITANIDREFAPPPAATRAGAKKGMRRISPSSVRSDVPMEVDGDARRPTDWRMEAVDKLSHHREGLLRTALFRVKRRGILHLQGLERLPYPHWFWEWSTNRRPPRRVATSLSSEQSVTIEVNPGFDKDMLLRSEKGE